VLRCRLGPRRGPLVLPGEAVIAGEGSDLLVMLRGGFAERRARLRQIGARVRVADRGGGTDEEGRDPDHDRRDRHLALPRHERIVVPGRGGSRVVSAAGPVTRRRVAWARALPSPPAGSAGIPLLALGRDADRLR